MSPVADDDLIERATRVLAEAAEGSPFYVHHVQALADAGLLRDRESVARSREVEATLASVEPILALLHYRGLVDSPNNREDVRAALARVRFALSDGRQL